MIRNCLFVQLKGHYYLLLSFVKCVSSSHRELISCCKGSRCIFPKTNPLVSNPLWTNDKLSTFNIARLNPDPTHPHLIQIQLNQTYSTSNQPTLNPHPTNAHSIQIQPTHIESTFLMSIHIITNPNTCLPI